MRLPRFFARAPFTRGNGDRVSGWVVCDHALGLMGEPIHEDSMDEATARALAKGLNDGTITPEEVARA